MSIKVNGPDGLEAWGVALAACFINFVMGGLGRMSGMLYVAFIDMFKVDRLQASVPFSARSLTRNLLGPVAGILGQKYGVSTTSVVGAIIGTVSAAACFYADDMLWITILWGVMNGLGCALTMTLPQVVLGKHFKKHRTTASGFAFSGGCLGAFLFPVILEHLLIAYGLGGTFLLMAGLIMNVIPAGMVLKEPSWLKKEPKKDGEVLTISKDFNHKLPESDRTIQSRNWKCLNVKYGTETNSPVELKKGTRGTNLQCTRQEEFLSSSQNLRKSLSIDTHFLRRENKLVLLLITEYSGNKSSLSDKISFYLYEDNLLKQLEQVYTVADEIMNEESNLEKPMPVPFHPQSSTDALSNSGNNFDKNQRDHNKSNLALISEDMDSILKTSKEFMLSRFSKLITEDTDNLLTVFHEREHPVILKVIRQLRHIYELLESKIEKGFTQGLEMQNNPVAKSKDIEVKGDSNTFFTHTKTALRLHKNPLFLLISFCRSVHFITFVPAVTVIVDYSMDKGLVQEDGKYVIAALSFGYLFGRICLGWVTDREYLSLPRYMLLVMILQGACTASLSLVNSRAPLLALIALFGLLQGSLFIRHPVLVSKYLGKNEQSVAMGCFNFFSGVLGFALPSYIGYFRDTVGTYNGMFYINGGIGTLVGIMWCFEPYFNKCVKTNAIGDEPA